MVLNGGLNLSVLDGWWAEAYDGTNGFGIGTGLTHSSTEQHDRMDSDAFYRVLATEVDPTLLPARQGRLTARLDCPHKDGDSHARLAVKR